MAFGLVAFTVTFQLYGVNDGQRKKPVEFLPHGIDIAAQRANLDTDIATWLDTFNGTNDGLDTSGVSIAFVDTYTISELWAESTNIPSSPANSDVYKEIALTSVLDDTGKKASVYIPAPSSRMFVGDSFNTQVVDIADTDLLAYGTQFTATAGYAALSDGQQWENPLNVVGARLRSVRSGKSF